MAVSDLPGYLQGFVFANSAAYYDSTNKIFLDQSPYSGWDNNHLYITTGTPSFTTLNGQEGMILDNTVQGYFLCPTAWEGSVIAVMQPNMSVNGTVYPVQFGGAVSASANGKIRMTRASGTDFRPVISSASATAEANPVFATQQGQVVAFSLSQETRKAYATKDGSTLIESAAVTDAGIGINMFSSGSTNATEGFRARFGNLSGTIADFAATTNTMSIYELHFFKGNLLVDQVSALTTEISALKTKYAIS